MSGWSLRLLSGASVNPAVWGEQSDLTAATSKRVSVYLDQPHEISFSINGEHPEAALVEELFSDVVAYYDDGTGTGAQRKVRCRVGPTSDNADGTGITTSFRALSYKDMLNRRYINADTTYPASPTGLNGIEGVGWQLISQTQAVTNGSLGITRGTSGAGTATVSTTPEIIVERGQSVGEQIDKLFEDNTYWWDITADLVYQTYQRRMRRAFVLDYGGSVAGFNRTVDPSTYANVVKIFGGTPTTPPGGYVVPNVTAASAEVLAGTARQGRWEKYIFDTEEYSTTRAQSRADTAVADAQVVTPTYTMTLVPGMWHGPDDLWIGDLTQVSIVAGRLNVQTDLMVTAMTFDIGDDGEETVSVTCGGLSPRDAYYQRQRKVLQAIAQLERR